MKLVTNSHHLSGSLLKRSSVPEVEGQGHSKVKCGEQQRHTFGPRGVEPRSFVHFMFCCVFTY